MKSILSFIILPLILCFCGSQTYKPTFPNAISKKIYLSALWHNENSRWIYDASYYSISFPNGDVPSGGACTDVVIRVLRDVGIDLQKDIHYDMLKRFNDYPNKWGLIKPDKNIDHRRVPNIMTFLNHKGFSVKSNKPFMIREYFPGDIICWELAPGTTHIGISLGNKAVYHNMGPMARIDKNFVYNHTIIGHYRININ